ncbi:hypothetical protein QAD02_002601 [Eretmocerus hayati]|uniref:Uncharacterized protein n=1 Tax=Eretmocerus hayati TaxID=131215 RepID=A0ACC2NJT2_9HYME|nr:hypothetical protein QAD02_002601 [Eretmocerus hayati]
MKNPKVIFRKDMSSRIRKACDFLTAYMAEHPHFEQLKDNGPDEKGQRKKQWTRLCCRYNRIVGTDVSQKSLQRKWKRMKGAAKKEWAENKRKPTGNVTENEMKDISTDTLKIMCIVGTSHGNRLPLVPEVGMGYRSEFDTIDCGSVASIENELGMRFLHGQTEEGSDQNGLEKASEIDARSMSTKGYGTDAGNAMGISSCLREMNILLKKTTTSQGKVSEIRDKCMRRNIEAFGRCRRQKSDLMNNRFLNSV